MPNETGKNGWGSKQYPPDDELREYLIELAKLPLSVDDKLLRLRLNLNLDIKKSTFFTLQRKLNIPSIKHSNLTTQECEQAVVSLIHRDVNQLNGPLAIKSTLQNNLIFIPRDVIRGIMHQYAPEGFDLRFPGRRKRIKRQALTSIGPYHEVSADGHEKLNSQALRMGSLGIPIYGYRDKWSGYVLKLCILPDARQAGAIGHIYLDCIEEWGGIPMQLTTDKGPEIGWQHSIQATFRDFFAPGINAEQYPPFVCIKSTRNIVIESFWRQLREKVGMNLKDAILEGKVKNYFVDKDRHHDLFYYIFVPLIQAALDNFRTYWNKHIVRSQSEKRMPSGHVPEDALQNCELFNGQNCLVNVSKQAQLDMREILAEDVGTREELLSWYSHEFGQVADEAYNAIGCPKFDLSNAWEVFHQLSTYMGL